MLSDLKSLMDKLHEEWFANPKWWFDASADDDALIASKFGHLLSYDHQPSCDVATIILFDQIPRHVFRGQPCEHLIAYYRQRALRLSLCLLEDDATMEKMSSAEICFVMLPLRHCGYIEKALEKAWRFLEQRGNDEYLKRFLKATYNKALATSVFGGPFVYSGCANRFRHILAHSPAGEPLDCSGTQFVDFALRGRVIVSLSGGVDSMVASWVLKCLGVDMVAVHINYCNRETAYLEEEFVRNWCAYGLGGVPCFVRRIEEIQRAPCMKHGMRELYEMYTRNVRYTAYKTVWADARVVLGHNRDDCLENIFTNIANKSKYENLLGIKSTCALDGIDFLRPLLHKTKEEIYAFAQTYNIPYLPTSTPEWSQRGKIRRDVVPCLEKWNEKSVSGLYALADEMSMLYGFMSAQIAEMDKNKIVFRKGDETYKSKTFWKEFLKNQKVSTKSLERFVEMLEKPGKRMFVLRKGFEAEMAVGDGGREVVFLNK